MRAALLTAAVLTLMVGSGKTKKYLVETEQHSDKKPPHRYRSPHTLHQRPHRGGGSQNKGDYDCINVEQTKRARLSFLHISI